MGERKEVPIPFSGPMVRAILDGTKTQTRRVVKVCGEVPPRWATFAKEGHNVSPNGSGPTGHFYWSEEQAPGKPLKVLRRWPVERRVKHPMLGSHYWARCPYGRVGDRLWVRETWQYADWTEDGEPYIRYAADRAKRGFFGNDAPEDEALVDVWAHLSRPENYEIDGKAADRKWRPSIFMPRWASRLLLKITDVRVERLQSISANDCRAEGHPVDAGRSLDQAVHDDAALDWYRDLWDSLNAERGFGWDVNPWVWVISFTAADAAGGRA